MAPVVGHEMRGLVFFVRQLDFIQAREVSAIGFSRKTGMPLVMALTAKSLVTLVG